MQRSLSDKRIINTFLWVLFFVLYSSLATIYPFLPPLFGVLLVLFVRSLEDGDTFAIVINTALLLVFEANNGYLFLSSVIYFYLLYKFVMPKIYTNFSCVQCVRISYPLLAYLGYFLFLSFVANIFLLPMPHIDYYIVYYIIVEFLIVSLL